MFAAVLDTCVLWPSTQRDFLLSLSAEHLYRPLWSAAILEELELQESRKLQRRGVPSLEADRRAAHLVGEMRKAFDDAEVMGWEALEGSFGLPDPNDEHVVAAAVVGAAGAIVTLNDRDFPIGLMPEGIDILTPADFALNTVELDPASGLRAVGEMANRSGRRGPRLSVHEILEILEGKYGMQSAVGILRDAL